jgi:hypothetical protein
MDQNNREEAERFTAAIASLATAFRQEATQAVYGTYRVGVGDLSVVAIEQAVVHGIRGCRFMPTAAELRELAGEMLPEHRAVKAWEVVIAQMGHTDHYDSVDFDDPVINATIRNLNGGERAWEDWPELLEADDYKWVRKDFERIYVALAKSGITAVAGSPLIGFFDRDNSAKGHVGAVKEPLRIACGLPPHRPGVVGLPAPTAVQGLLENVGTAPEGMPAGKERE